MNPSIYHLQILILIFLVLNLANGYKITYKEPAPIGMGDYGSIKFKVILEGLEEETWFEYFHYKQSSQLAEESQKCSLGQKNP